MTDRVALCALCDEGVTAETWKVHAKGQHGGMFAAMRWPDGSVAWLDIDRLERAS